MSSDNIAVLAFGGGLFAASGIYGILFVTLATDRQWWPPGDRSWKYYLHWSLVGLFNISIVVVALTTWNQWILPRPASIITGVVLSVMGAGIFIQSARVMRSDEVAGVTGELYTEGPYSYSRNPQYVGMIIGLIGFPLVVNSLYVTILATVHIGWVLLLPHAEEPHLCEEFGFKYERYKAEVPRFVGRITLQKLRSA